MATGLVKRPGNARDDAASDLGEPVRNLLIGLNMLETTEDVNKNANIQTPFSLQVITSGATALGKSWPALIAFLGGGGAIASAIGGYSETGTERAVLVASAAFIAASAVIAIAIIVRADVQARAVASAAQYEARGVVTAALLDTFVYGPTPQPPYQPEPFYMLKLKEGPWYPVIGLELKNGSVVANVGGGVSFDATKFDLLVPTNVWRAKQG